MGSAVPPPSVLQDWFEMAIPADMEGARWLARLSAAGRRPAAVERAFERAARANRQDEAAALAIAALIGVWETGRGLDALEAWRCRAAGLLRETLSPLAAAALRLHLAISGLIGDARLGDLVGKLPLLREAVEASGSNPMRWLAAAIDVHIQVMHGDLRAATACLDDAAYLPEVSGRHVCARVYLAAASALVSGTTGRATPFDKGLDSWLDQVEAAGLPAHLLLTARAHLLLSLARSRDMPRVAQAAHHLRRMAIPVRRAFHHSYLHYALGVAALLEPDPATARVHAQLAVEHARRSGSRLAQLVTALLLCQATRDAGDDDEALHLLQEHVGPWRAHGFRLQEATAWNEQAAILAARGQWAHVQAYRELARRLKGDDALPFLHRPLVATPIEPAPGIAVPAAPPADGRPVHIRTLGAFEVAVNGQPLLDGALSGRVTRQLLFLIIALGGVDVPASQLADAMWPDADGAKAQQNLKVALWRLRRQCSSPTLGKQPWVSLRHGTVSLDARVCAVDVIEFQHSLGQCLEEAREPSRLLIRYTGDFLPGEDMPAVQACRERLDRLRMKGFAQAIQLATANNAPVCDPRWAGALESALQASPGFEPGWEMLMRYHLLVGQPLQALLAFNQADAALLGSNGASAGKQLLALREQARDMMLEEGCGQHVSLAM